MILSIVRGCYGAALLAVPGLAIRAGTGRPASAADRRVARVLGIRHLLQAGVTGFSPAAERSRARTPEHSGVSGYGRRVLVVGAAADLVHAVSMIGVAAVSRGGRRAALTDAAVEIALAGAGVLTARG
jgi:hypothetical protein